MSNNPNMVNPASAPQKKSGLTRVLIGCGILFAISIPLCGILSAIAIPAFMRSVKKSKEAEASMMVRKIAESAKYEWETSCKFPPALAQTGNPVLTCGGAKHVPEVADSSALGTMVTLDEPMYFIYSTEVTSQGSDEVVYTVRAQHDFDCGTPAMHTVEMVITGIKTPEGLDCTATMTPSVTLDEFE